MDGFQNSKNCNLDKPFPGCLGRMVNLFDFNSGVAGNRMLTDKPHGSPLGSQSDVVRMCDQIEERVIVSDLRRASSNRNSNGTPMKMLIDQEMIKEIDSSHNPPNVVAKLMGLDAFPMQNVVSAATRRSHSGGHSPCYTDSSFSYCQYENESVMGESQHVFHQYKHHNEYTDVYEVWQQSPKMNCARNKSLQKARHAETTIDKKAAFVRQKFNEAKCLSIDEKLRQSKKFQDALEVLNSNTDLFLKFLQEPNQMSSQNLYNMQSIPPPPETKRITVLRPSKMVDNNKFGGSDKKNETEMRRATQGDQGNRADKSHQAISPPPASRNIDENPAQPTRIVVLKPSPGKTHEFRTASSPPSASLRVSQPNGAQKSKEVAKALTHQMREDIGGHQRDETLLSSVFSNGEIGGESSFKSENEYAAGNLSDSEVMSPAPRHSWDYINKLGSPYSCSSSRASYSPESSVTREAKKRLSERWAMVASNGSCQEQRHHLRSSSTLGEMLALSDIKKTGRTELESSKEEPRTSNSNSVGYSSYDDGIDKSPKTLLRSKSVPVSSTAFSPQLNVDAPNSETGKVDLPKETTKLRSTKSSLKGKVSNLFFSRNKRPSKDRANSLQSSDGTQSDASSIHYPTIVDKDKSEFLNDPRLECSSPDRLESPSNSTSYILAGRQGVITPEVGQPVSKSLPSGNACENQDQPSPISVLETAFEEDEHPARLSSGSTKPDQHGNELSPHPIRSNLIDKSPPIESIARTLSWDDSCVDTASSFSSKPSSSTQWTEEEEREWFSSVQTLLVVAGLDDVQCDTISSMWHSPESPLDPSLREKYIDLNEKDTLDEARRKQRRSTRKLVFDCVNVALLDIAGHGPDTFQRVLPYNGDHPQGARLILKDQVWARIKEWFYSEVKCLVNDGEDDVNSLVVEGMVRKEVVGKGWVESMRIELGNVGMEIEEELLEELVHESVFEFTGRI